MPIPHIVIVGSVLVFMLIIIVVGITAFMRFHHKRSVDKEIKKVTTTDDRSGLPQNVINSLYKGGSGGSDVQGNGSARVGDYLVAIQYGLSYTHHGRNTMILTDLRMFNYDTHTKKIYEGQTIQSGNTSQTSGYLICDHPLKAIDVHFGDGINGIGFQDISTFAVTGRKSRLTGKGLNTQTISTQQAVRDHGTTIPFIEHGVVSGLQARTGAWFDAIRVAFRDNKDLYQQGGAPTNTIEYGTVFGLDPSLISLTGGYSDTSMACFKNDRITKLEMSSVRSDFYGLTPNIGKLRMTVADSNNQSLMNGLFPSVFGWDPSSTFNVNEEISFTGNHPRAISFVYATAEDHLKIAINGIVFYDENDKVIPVTNKDNRVPQDGSITQGFGYLPLGLGIPGVTKVKGHNTGRYQGRMAYRKIEIPEGRIFRGFKGAIGEQSHISNMQIITS